MAFLPLLYMRHERAMFVCFCSWGFMIYESHDIHYNLETALLISALSASMSLTYRVHLLRCNFVPQNTIVTKSNNVAPLTLNNSSKIQKT
ncbi:hypothetical protein CDL12_13475 [Handroanthus impetiginosus]|uniref:Uncharacterized protein n=1 Tax=Handroanthus impetiginosus TaxID=429701 RepID=A0A2G9H8R8_9LAMI|nr:hypothetical protein CDL12_13475 [Handroanthus impetiginosus]